MNSKSIKESSCFRDLLPPTDDIGFGDMRVSTSALAGEISELGVKALKVASEEAGCDLAWVGSFTVSPLANTTRSVINGTGVNLKDGSHHPIRVSVSLVAD